MPVFEAPRTNVNVATIVGSANTSVIQAQNLVIKQVPHTLDENTPVAQTHGLPAPVLGIDEQLVNNAQDTAIVMQNFWPTEKGLEIRRGYRRVGSLGTESPPLRLIPYEGKKELLAQYEGEEIKRLGVGLEGSEAIVADLGFSATGAPASYAEVQTEFGSFLIMVNGVDPMLVYDGDVLVRVNDLEVRGLSSIDRVPSTNFSHVWTYGRRVFFIQKDTNSAWYLDIGSIPTASGRATELPLGAVFNHGGQLLSGFTWSVDVGDTLTDRCVFVTTNGEYAVYNGDPDIDFAIDGVYRAGILKSRNSFFKLGGDTHLLMSNGVKSFSEIVRGGSDGNEPNSLDKGIAGILRRTLLDADEGDQFEAEYLRSADMVLFGNVTRLRLGPEDVVEGNEEQLFVRNSRIGAWATIKGWPVSAMAVLGESLYFSDKKGFLYKAWEGAIDGVNPYTAYLRYSFGAISGLIPKKVVSLMNGVWDTVGEICPEYGLVDYQGKPAIDDPGTCFSARRCSWDECKWPPDGDPLWVWGLRYSRRAQHITERWKVVGERSNVFSADVKVTVQDTVHPESTFFGLNLVYTSEGRRCDQWRIFSVCRGRVQGGWPRC